MGTRIKELRKSKHMSQNALALAIGSSQSVICKIERGDTLADSELLCKIASFFNTSVDYVLERTDTIDFFPNTSTLNPRTIYYAKKLDNLAEKEKETIFTMVDLLSKAAENTKE